MNVPKLRFKEFNDEWNYNSLSNYVERIITKNKNNESNLVLTISAQYGLVDQVKFFNRKVSSSNISGYYLLNNGDFAYNKSYSNGYPWGAIKRLNNYNQGVVSSLYICFRPKNNIDSDYLEQYFETNKWYRQVSEISVEGARNHGLLNIAVNDFFETKHYIPSIMEQAKIGQTLQLLDKKIELQTKKIETLKLFKKGLLKCEYNKIKNKNLSQLDNIAQIYQPQTLSQKQLKKGVYPVFGANGIIGFNSNFNHKLPQITISCRGENSGSINKTPEYCWINGNSMVINVDNNPNINKDYLKLILESQNLKYLISGSGQPQIIRSDIAKHKIPIISIDEQLIYIKKFNLLESKLPLEISKLKKLNLLKKGLMQNMFI